MGGLRHDSKHSLHDGEDARPTGAPWIASHPSGQTVNCGQTATFTAAPATGYSLVLASWRGNGVALNDGPTPHGSTISGAHASTLVISNAPIADAGSYDCVFSNLCGSATSAPATLTVIDWVQCSSIRGRTRYRPNILTWR